MAQLRVQFISLLIVIALSGASGQPPPPKPPNIVFVFVDDLGFSDVGFRNPKIKTPNFDDLSKTGLVLNRHYVYMYCSPSRASFLTGRWPYHVHQWNIGDNTVLGTHINMTMLPAKLKTKGYSTHMVGKWHQGYYDPAYLPVNRGFDSSSGFLNAGEDHMTEVTGCAVDFWKNKAPDTRNGSYDSYIYRSDLTDIINKHNTSKPLFLYLPLHNVHAPIEAPQEWINLYPESTCNVRRTLQAMVSVADNVTGHAVQLLKERGMWDNTIMVVSADNGASPCHGSNYPLKGTKWTLFEGGVRSMAFVNGGRLPDSMRGKTSDGFIHVADWYPTFCKMAGIDPDDSGPRKFPVDGIDVWRIISGDNSTTPHEEIVLAYNFTLNANATGAIIVGKYKLIVGPQQGKHFCDSLMNAPIDYPCTNGTVGKDCDPYCLFDIIADPGERKDLSKTEPDILKMMLDRYNRHAKENQEMMDQGIHSERGHPQFKEACDYMSKNGGYWQPWVNV